MKNIIHIISNKTWGGGERYALDLCNALRSQNHRVAIVCRNNDAVSGPLRDAGFEPALMKLGGAFDIFSPVHIARMVRRFEGNGPVNIHVHNFKDAALAVKAKALCADSRPVNVVCTRHLVKPGKPAQVKLYRNIDEIVFVSERARNEFLKGKFDSSELNMRVIHNALPNDDTLPAADTTANPPLILYAGRLSSEKGAHIFVQALIKLRDLNWRARICGQGEGKYVMPLLRQCRAAGIDDRVEWPGHISDISNEIAKAQIGVVPTVAPEAFGLSIIEMMRQRLPVITSNNGAQNEIISTEAEGLTVAPGDAQALADKLSLLIENNELRTSIGRAGYERFIQQFTYPAFYNEICNTYK